MKRFAISLLAITPFLIPACSSNDSSSDQPPATTGGSAGKSGSGGSSSNIAGKGGGGTTSASSGSSGAPSAAAGGAIGGSGGAGGEAAGASGLGGVSGSGGVAGASAGSGGVAGGAGSGGVATAGSGGTDAGGEAGAGGDSSIGGGGASGGFTSCANLPLMLTPPKTVSEIGLYTDNMAGTVQPYAIPFAPDYKLWSDGADKRRWMYLPCGSQIDTSDMDIWQFPVGTRAWKEFSLNGTRVETRIIHRFGPGPSDFFMMSYQWRADQTEADAIPPTGASNVLGTGWTIPRIADCGDCHNHFASRYLGFGAIQLSDSTGGTSLSDLSDKGMLTNPGQSSYPLPFDPVTNAGVGYLHGNCGGCHNPGGVNSLHMRIPVTAQTVADTQVFQTAVNVEATNQVGGFEYRIKAGDADESVAYYRMSHRDQTPGEGTQMPPIATYIVDPTGMAAVKAWIDSLPANAGAGGTSGSAGASGSAGSGGLGSWCFSPIPARSRCEGVLSY